MYLTTSILDQLRQIATDLAKSGDVYYIEETGDLVVLGLDGRPNRLGPALLRAYVEKVTVFVSTRPKRDDPGGLTEVPIPAHVLNAFIERRSYPELKQYRGTRKGPFIGSDSKIVNRAGYDEGSGIFLMPHEPIDLPAEPTQEEARREMRFVLDDVYGDFPLTENDRSVVATAIFTVAARQATGPAPGIIFDAHTAGAGKTTAAEITAMIALGEQIDSIPFRGNKDEFSKTVVTSLRSKRPVVCVDNVSDGLGCPELDAIITSRSGKVRVRNLGKLEELELSTQTVVFATGNGIRLDGDLRRRVLWVRFDPQQEDPETRTGFKHKKLYDHVLETLPRLRRAVLLCWEAFRLADPKDRSSGLPLLGSFETWSEKVRDLVVWLGLPDPALSRAIGKERDPERVFLSTFIAVLDRLDPKGKGLFASEITAAALHNKNGDLAEALTDFKQGNTYSTKALGRKLAKLDGSHVGDRKLASHKRHNQAAWRVEKKVAQGTGSTSEPSSRN